MNVLYGLYQPDAGELRFDGRAGAAQEPARRDRARGGHGAPALHARAHADAWPRTWCWGASRAAAGCWTWRPACAQVAEMCARFGFQLDPRARVDTLRVGSQQKVEIVKALHRGAQMLILDEPTAVLTPAGGRRAVRGDAGARRRGAHGGAHQPQAATRCCAVADRIAVMRRGQAWWPSCARRRRAARAARRADGGRGPAALQEPERGGESTPGRGAARGRAGCRRSATTGSRPCAGCPCACAPGRSSASPASTATASASSPRCSPACARWTAARGSSWAEPLRGAHAGAGARARRRPHPRGPAAPRDRGRCAWRRTSRWAGSAAPPFARGPCIDFAGRRARTEALLRGLRRAPARPPRRARRPLRRQPAEGGGGARAGRAARACWWWCSRRAGSTSRRWRRCARGCARRARRARGSCCSRWTSTRCWRSPIASTCCSAGGSPASSSASAFDERQLGRRMLGAGAAHGLSGLRGRASLRCSPSRSALALVLPRHRAHARLRHRAGGLRADAVGRHRRLAGLARGRPAHAAHPPLGRGGHQGGAAHPHRPLGGGRLPRGALQHRRAGPDDGGRAARGGGGRGSSPCPRPSTCRSALLGGARSAGAALRAGARARSSCARGVHEVITTIMLNWIAVSLVENWLVVGPLRASASGDNSLSGTEQILASAQLPRLLGEPLAPQPRLRRSRAARGAARLGLARSHPPGLRVARGGPGPGGGARGGHPGGAPACAQAMVLAGRARGAGGRGAGAGHRVQVPRPASARPTASTASPSR